LSHDAKHLIRVLIADDHPSIRRGLEFMISAAEDIECVGECSDGAQAIECAKTLRPDVVIMDLAMPVIDGVKATQRIRADNPDVQVLVLTSYVDPERVQGALQAGAIGYLMKTADDDEVIRAIRAAAAGQRVIALEATNALVASALTRPASDVLTEREVEVLRLMAKGMSNQEIATKLFLALPTVKFHITNILSKMGMGNRTEAVLAAIRMKWVPAPDET
jgi:NarL family two-component system response regulator LiaR